MKVPYLDLQAQYQGIKDEIKDALNNVLDTNAYILGPDVKAFEDEFATYCEAQHCIATNSGTSALHLALLAGGIGPGDEVITVPFTFVATVAAILYAGATPVLIDIQPASFTMDPANIEAAITPRTRAIMPVHLYGQAADMDPILEIAKRHNLLVIEDAAQAHGAEYNGRRVGAIGDIGCFSFYPGKNLGAYGEGGAVTTNNAEYDHKIRVLRDWGQEKKYHHSMIGYNYRRDGLQRAILRVKLRRLEEWTEARRACAARYDAELEGVAIVRPPVMPYARHVYHTYTFRTDRRDALQVALQEQGIATGVHYPIPVHLQEGYAGLGYSAGDFPEAERAAREVLSLPIYPELSTEQQDMVVAAVREFLGAQPVDGSR